MKYRVQIWIKSFFGKHFLCIGVLILILCSNPVRSEEPVYPFVPGERLTYNLSWGAFSVGKVMVEVGGPISVNGIMCYKFSFIVKSNKFTDTFYKVRDKINGYVDLELKRSIYYTKKQREGNHKRDVIVDFDWKSKHATYTNFGQEHKAIPLPESAYDPLTILFVARLQSLKVGRPFTLPVTDGKQYIDSKVHVIKKETIHTELGKFNTFLLQPGLDGIGGVFKKSKNANIRIWFSDDHYKIPIKLKSKVAIGSFRAVLVSIDRPDNYEHIVLGDPPIISSNLNEG